MQEVLTGSKRQGRSTVLWEVRRSRLVADKFREDELKQRSRFGKRNLQDPVLEGGDGVVKNGDPMSYPRSKPSPQVWKAKSKRTEKESTLTDTTREKPGVKIRFS